jgi:hypothetical protein
LYFNISMLKYKIRPPSVVGKIFELS